MKPLPDRLAFLRDKLQSWPGEMCLTSEDIANLISLIESSPEPGKPAPLPAEVEEAWQTVRGLFLEWCGFLPRCRPKGEAVNISEDVAKITQVNAALDTIRAALGDLAALDVLAFSLADYDKGLLNAAILIDRLRAMLRERGK